MRRRICDVTHTVLKSPPVPRGGSRLKAQPEEPRDKYVFWVLKRLGKVEMAKETHVSLLFNLKWSLWLLYTPGRDDPRRQHDYASATLSDAVSGITPPFQISI